MIQLTPLDKTVAGQELIQMGFEKGHMKGHVEGRAEGHTEGVEKGELIGKIHTMQRFLKRRATPKKNLLAQSPKELRSCFKNIRGQKVLGFCQMPKPDFTVFKRALSLLSC